MVGANPPTTRPGLRGPFYLRSRRRSRSLHRESEDAHSACAPPDDSGSTDNPRSGTRRHSFTKTPREKPVETHPPVRPAPCKRLACRLASLGRVWQDQDRAWLGCLTRAFTAVLQQLSDGVADVAADESAPAAQPAASGRERETDVGHLHSEVGLKVSRQALTGRPQRGWRSRRQHEQVVAAALLAPTHAAPLPESRARWCRRHRTNSPPRAADPLRSRVPAARPDETGIAELQRQAGI